MTKVGDRKVGDLTYRELVGLLKDIHSYGQDMNYTDEEYDEEEK
jgi:hypothetical protein